MPLSSGRDGGRWVLTGKREIVGSRRAPVPSTQENNGGSWSFVVRELFTISPSHHTIFLVVGTAVSGWDSGSSRGSEYPTPVAEVEGSGPGRSFTLSTGIWALVTPLTSSLGWTPGTSPVQSPYPGSGSVGVFVGECLIHHILLGQLVQEEVRRLVLHEPLFSP